jgi:diguanylate cyclase (GGDEF)-like protein
MSRERIVFLAATVRFVIAALTLLLLPIVAPGLAEYYVVFAAYVALAGIFQILIWRDIGGTTRTLATGIVDAAIITFFVHLVGSVGSATVALYPFAAMINTVIAGRRIGTILAATGAAMYATLLACEGAGLLPFAAAGPSWVSGTPTTLELFASGSLVVTLAIAGTLSIGALVDHDEKNARALVEANRKLEELSQRDALTGLYNRRYLMQRIDDELAWLRRGRPLAALMIDLDRFKRVNDESGHARGDVLLTEIARALMATVRSTDVVARYGGDEFVVLLTNMETQNAEIAAERIVLSIREAGLAFDRDRAVTASLGLAIAERSDDARALFERADRAVYAAKSRAGDRVCRDDDARSGSRPIATA